MVNRRIINTETSQKVRFQHICYLSNFAQNKKMPMTSSVQNGFSSLIVYFIFGDKFRVQEVKIHEKPVWGRF